MKDDIRATILWIVKGSVLLIVAGAVFYNVYPKYTFEFKEYTAYRFNEVTGTLEVRDEKKWEVLAK